MFLSLVFSGSIAEAIIFVLFAECEDHSPGNLNSQHLVTQKGLIKKIIPWGQVHL